MDKRYEQVVKIKKQFEKEMACNYLKSYSILFILRAKGTLKVFKTITSH